MIEYQLSIDDDTDHGDRGRVAESVAEALSNVLSRLGVTKMCPHCGGEGSVTETREIRLDELSSRQMTFMYVAWMKRQERIWGDGEGGQSGASTQQPQSQWSQPQMGSPPVKGNVNRR